VVIRKDLPAGRGEESCAKNIHCTICWNNEKGRYRLSKSSQYGGQENTTFLEQTNHILKRTIADALPGLDRDLQQTLKKSPVDLILTSVMYFGSLPLVLRSGERRPPVIGCGVNPLMLSGLDCEHLSPPDNRPGGRQRIREANLQIQMAFAPMQEALNGVLNKYPFQPCLSFGWMPSLRSPKETPANCRNLLTPFRCVDDWRNRCCRTAHFCSGGRCIGLRHPH
jgi:hypothetical protein